MPLPPSGVPQNYTLTFSDEFNGTELDAWTGHGSDGLWATSFSPHLDDTRTITANGESQWYVDPDDTTLPNPFEVSNGTLKITAQEVPTADQGQTGGLPYASGLLTTEMTFAAETGYFEMRADVPDVEGFLSAMWLLPADGDWTAEIDIFEQLGSDTDTLNTNVWDNGVPDEGRDVIAGLGDGMHTFGVHWTETEISWIVDGVTVRTVANTVNEPMFLAVSLAVGTNWTGPVPNGADISQPFEIDYIRIYEDGANTDTQVYDGTNASESLFGTRWDDEFRGRQGDDIMYGRAGDDHIKGNKGADELFGQEGNDRLQGGQDNDKLIGGDGTDTLVGGKGNDNLWGGSFSGGDGERDIFVFKTHQGGSDLVHDFEIGIDDIKLKHFNTTWTDVQAAMDDQGWATVIDLAALGGQAGDRVSILNVAAADLTQSDFIL